MPIFAHYKHFKLGVHDVSLQFQGYFRDEIRLQLSVDEWDFIIDMSSNGDIHNARALRYAFQGRIATAFDPLLDAIMAYFKEIPQSDDSTPISLIIQPFHIHEYTFKTQVPGLDRCHSTEEVVSLMERHWPGSVCHKGGHHVVAQIGGRYIKIHETWDARTCSGSQPQSDEDADQRSYFQRLVDRRFPSKLAIK